MHPRWTQWATGVLAAFANCQVAIYDPNNEAQAAGDPYAPPTTAPMTLVWQGEGQLAVFRQTLNADDVSGSVTQIRSVRFTVPLDGPAMPVRKGLIVRVISCDNDPDATAYEYTVTSGINSGLAWKRTIEAEADMAVIVEPIEETT